MQPCAVDWVFGNKEDFFVIWVKGTVDQSVSEWFNVLLFLVFEKPLINNFLKHLLRVNDGTIDIWLFRICWVIVNHLRWSKLRLWFPMLNLLQSLKCWRKGNIYSNGSKNLMLVQSNEDILRQVLNVINYSRMLMNKQLLDSSERIGTWHKAVNV